VRARLLALGAVVACTIPDKHPVALDAGGIDVASPDTSPDREAPETVLTVAPPPFAATGTTTFEFASDDPDAAFTCRLDGAPPTGCLSPVTHDLDDGPHGFSVRAIDRAGNEDPTPAEVVWTIDTVAPDTVLTATPPLADNSVVVHFEFGSDEANVTFECSIDNAMFTGCTSGGAFGPLADGPHAFAVRARDRAGNLDGTPTIYAWAIDTTLPDTQIISGPIGATASKTAMFTFISPDGGGGATFQCALDGAAFTACTSPATYSNLAERAHELAVRVRDAVGNFDPTPAVRAWVVDVTRPNTTIASGPAGTVASASASFAFVASENATFECQLDAVGFLPCLAPHAITQLAQGAHAFAVRAIDLAGNVDLSPATRSWTVDTISPVVSISTGPTSGGTTGPRVNFAFTTSEGTMVCRLDGNPPGACTGSFAVNLPAGPHSFEVDATDAAGNVGSAAISWTVACAAPTVAGAASLLHLDDTGQALANAVAGRVAAVLGDTTDVEIADPTPVPGRFGGGLAFASPDADHVTWPALLGATSAFTIELWSRPAATAGAQTLLASDDGRLAIEVVAASPTTVHYQLTVTNDTGKKSWTATSAVVAGSTWHHLLATLADTDLTLWVDGAPWQKGGADIKQPLSLDGIRLGDLHDGSLDEVWIAQTALTDVEGVLQRYCPF